MACSSVHTCMWMRAQHFAILPTFLQLYNEDINDLLAPENQKLQVGCRAGRVASWLPAVRSRRE